MASAISDADPFSCPRGKLPLIASDGLHQLHMFIFFLAVFHVIFSAMTMALGRAKIRRWKEWEKETTTLNYEFSNDPSKFKFAHETSFVRKHAGVSSQSTVMLYLAHLSPGSKFNFKQFIKRSLDDDLKTVVCISAHLRTIAMLVLLLNVHASDELFWVSAVPLVVVLAVGTKLQAIITTMAVDIKDKHRVIQGLPVVKLSDENFWFEDPRFVLGLIHFALFQNAFDITHL